MRPRGYGSPIRKEVQVTPVELKLPAAHPRQHEFITYLDNHPECRFVIGACGTKLGKAEYIENLIPTTKGLVKMKDIKEGDYVFNKQGKPIKVVYATDIMYGRKCYEVVFSDGTRVVCDADHLWEVKSHLCRKALERTDRPIKNSSHAAEVLTTEQIKQNLYYESSGKSRPNYTVDLCEPVEWPEQDLPIDPYLYGAWLGDGSSNGGQIACDANEQSVIDNIRALGYEVKQLPSCPLVFAVAGLTKLLHSNGIKDKNYIPECYKIGSVEQRLSLLQGLMDTDATVDKHTGYCTFDNTNKLIADLVAYLAQSLGIKVQRAGRWGKLNGVKKKWCYRVYFKTDKPVFRMQRKLQYINKVEMTVKSTRITITEVNEVESVPVRCIQVNDPSHLYLTGEYFRVTHNTMGCSMAILRHAWTHKQNLCWWVAPTYSQAENAFNIICKMLPNGTANIKKGDLKIEILRPDGKVQSTIEFKSGEKSGNLRGFAVNFFVIDEAALIDHESYISVMTTLTNTKGRGLIISTPKGRGWFYDVYKYGEKFNEDGSPKYSKDYPDPYPEYMSFRLPTSANPFNSQEAIALLKRDLPEDAFRQEVLAEFLTESAGVFKGIRSCISGELEAPKAGVSYVMGADLARINDYTVLTVVNDKNHVVFFERFNKVDWSMQLEYIKSKAKLYNNALVVIDSTGVGDAPTESLMKAGVRVKPFKIGNNNTKKQLIDRLRIAIEQKKISYPAIPNLISELEAYEYSITDGGVIRYSAPSGKHDDCVISLALANFYGSAAPFIYKAHSIPGI